MENAPKTIAELMQGRRWGVIRRLFKRNNAILEISTSEEAMGRFSQVILDGEGFRVKTSKAGLQAAFSGGGTPSYRSITTAEEVVELMHNFDESVSESSTVTEIVRKIDELHSSRRTAKV